ncbi:MAG TPA: Gfo/Idh/MocA family oxidoreductase [Bryobacteraceae bacterium]|nr:Gfo/Idh/MocA family oxidoreductase [Bryobacteraceae bacterium]
MPERPAYAVVGRGNWAGRMSSLLKDESCRVTNIPDARIKPNESDANYIDRLASAFRASHAAIAWLCVVPGPHVSSMISAAIDAGMHAIIEKPWLGSAREAETLTQLAVAHGVLLGVHFEYCLLNEIQDWRRRFNGGPGLRFNGRFAISRASRLDIPAMLNLGVHLFAIRKYAVPEAEIGEISTAYESDDERRVWIETESVEFTHNRQPIIERFLRLFEDATEGAEFPFGIDFARRVSEEAAKYPAPQTAASHPP